MGTDSKQRQGHDHSRYHPISETYQEADKYEYGGEEEIEYFLEIDNQTTALGGKVFAKNLKVTDTLPESLEIIESSITFFGVFSKQVTPPSVEVIGNRLEFSLSSLTTDEVGSLGGVIFKAKPKKEDGDILGNGTIISNEAKLTYLGNSLGAKGTDNVYLNSPVLKMGKNGREITNGSVYSLDITNEKPGTIGFGNIVIEDQIKIAEKVKNIEITDIILTKNGENIQILGAEANNFEQFIDSIEIDTREKTFKIVLDKAICLVNSNEKLPPMEDVSLADTSAFDLENLFAITKIEIKYIVKIKADETRFIDIENLAQVSFGENSEGIKQKETGNDDHYLPISTSTFLSIEKSSGQIYESEDAQMELEPPRVRIFGQDEVFGKEKGVYKIGESVPYEVVISNIGEQPAYGLSGADFITIDGVSFNIDSMQARLRKTSVDESDFSIKRSLSNYIDVTELIKITTDVSLALDEKLTTYIEDKSELSEINPNANFLFEYLGILDEGEQLILTYNLEIDEGASAYLSEKDLAPMDNFILAKSTNTDEPVGDEASIDIAKADEPEIDKPNGEVAKSRIGKSVYIEETILPQTFDSFDLLKMITILTILILGLWLAVWLKKGYKR